MRPGRECVAALVSLALAGAVRAEPPREAVPGERLFDAFDLGSSRKDPITVASDTLEYDYKRNVVVYRGQVQAAQGPVTLRSNTLTVTFRGARDGGGSEGGIADAGRGVQRVDQIVAEGSVRIEHGTRWATGGKAVFDQGTRTLVLSESPVLHDGSNAVAGDRVIVYLNEDRSVVEGGRKRVKAVLYPGKEGDLAPAPRERAAGSPGAASP